MSGSTQRGRRLSISNDVTLFYRLKVCLLVGWLTPFDIPSYTPLSGPVFAGLGQCFVPAGARWANNPGTTKFSRWWIHRARHTLHTAHSCGEIQIFFEQGFWTSGSAGRESTRWFGSGRQGAE